MSKNEKKNKFKYQSLTLGSPMQPKFFSLETNFPCFPLIQILLLVTKSENLAASWPQVVF